MTTKVVPYELNHAVAPAYWHVDILWAILASGEQTGGSLSLMDELCPRDSGPPPHYHDQDESFYLIDGEVTFTANGNAIKGKAGSFISIPRHTVHSFHVDSETARVLNFYAPAGFERTLSELAPIAQARTLPPKGFVEPRDAAKAAALFKEVGMHSPDELGQAATGKVKPYELNHAVSPAFWQVDILWTVLASGDQTGGSYSLMEELCPKDSGPPPHWHEQDEAFYLIDGEITFVADGKEIKGRTGSFILIPRHTVHSFRVDSATCRLLNWYAPAGFERTIIELAEAAPERKIPPQGRPLQADPQKVMALFKEVGMHPVEQTDTLRPDKSQSQYVGPGK